MGRNDKDDRIGGLLLLLHTRILQPPFQRNCRTRLFSGSRREAQTTTDGKVPPTLAAVLR